MLMFLRFQPENFLLCGDGENVRKLFNGIYIIKTLNVSFFEEELPFFLLLPKLLQGRECN